MVSGIFPKDFFQDSGPLHPVLLHQPLPVLFSFLHCRILSEQGVLGLYVGFSALMTRNLVYMMSKFLVFDFFTDIVLRVFGRLPTNNFLLVCFLASTG